MAGAAVISQGQLNVLRSQISQDRSAAAVGTAKQAREALKRASDERAAQWAAEVLADRAANAAERNRRLATAEARRVQQDEEEAAATSAKRAAVVAAAQRRRFEDQDAVRGLRSKLVLSEVDVARRAQTATERDLLAAQRAAETEYLQRRDMTLQAEEAAEARAAKAARAAALAQREVQMAQLEELKGRILSDRAATRAEGSIMKRRAAEAVEAAQREAAAARERALAANRATAAANDALQELKRMEKQQDIDADAAIAAYVAQKEALVAERQRRQEADAAAREAARQRNINALESAFLKARKDHDVRLEQEVQEAEDTAAAEEAVRVARDRAAWQANAESWAEQLAARRQAAAAARQQEAIDAAAVAAAAQAAAAADAAEAARRLARDRKCTAYLGDQVSEKQRRTLAAKLADCEEAVVQQTGAVAAMAHFGAYAAEIVTAAAAAGKPTKPLDMYLRKALKPEGLSAAQP